MGRVPFVPLAVLLDLVPAAPAEGGREAEAAMPAARIRGTSGSEPGELEKFLQMNPEEKFDLEAINSIDPQALVAEAAGNKRVLHEVVRTAEALLPRVRAETEDPHLVSAILRNKTLDWYRRSLSDRIWEETMPLRWGGIFQESRVPGGRLSRKLSSRLSSLITQCVEASGAVAFFRSGFTGLFRGSAMMASMVQFGLGPKRPRLTQHVAQAYLDDLAANARDGNRPLPLERLSDIARRYKTAEVNMTLAELFPQDSTTSLTVLDPRFHPGMVALTIRVVPPKTQEDAATYDLVQASGHASHESRATEEAATEESPGSPWDRLDMTKKDWLALFRLLEKRKARLDPPPRENSRDRESYLGLRDLVLQESAVRKAFLAVHWKGKPSGLSLLCQLLTEGMWAPEVETDADYLEAELDHLDRGHADRRPNDGQWKLAHGWTVAREVADGNVRTYRAHAKSAD